MEGRIKFDLYERGRWIEHELDPEIAKEVVDDVISQLDNESLAWLVVRLSPRQRDDLAELLTADRRERERSRLGGTAELGVLQQVRPDRADAR